MKILFTILLSCFSISAFAQLDTIKPTRYYFDGQFFAVPNYSGMYSLDYGALLKGSKHGFGISMNFNIQNYGEEEHSSVGWGLQYRYKLNDWVFRSEIGWAEVNIINNTFGIYEFISLNTGFNIRQEVSWSFWKGLNIGGGFSYFPNSLAEGTLDDKYISLFYPHVFVGYNWERDFKIRSANGGFFYRRAPNQYIFEDAFIFNVELSPFIIANNFSFSFGYQLRPDAGFGLSYMASGSMTLQRSFLIQYGFGAFYQKVADKYVLKAELGHIRDSGLRPENNFFLSSPIYTFKGGFTPYTKLVAALRTRRNWLLGISYLYTNQYFNIQEFDEYGKRTSVEDKRLNFHLPSIYLGGIISTKVRRN